VARARVAIRDARANDAPAVAELLGQLGYPASREAARRRLSRLLVSDADRILVAVLDGAVVGLAGVQVNLSLEYDEPAARLSALAVDGRHRGRGIGAALVAAIEAEARQRGCGLLFLTSAERRTDAHAFYRRTGFEETGRRFAKRLA
jgi:GNAT superfamily N-acetyltransferase